MFSTIIELGGMVMHLHENVEDFKDLILLTSEKLNLDPMLIEKDYWITHSLYHLSKSEYKHKVVFKGGTSLTKCYRDLRRFSEDIDIALLANDISSSQIKKILTRVEKVMSLDLQPGKFEEERKSGNYRYTQFKYKSLFAGNMMELHPNIRFELTSFMHPYPYENRMLGSFIEHYLDVMNMHDVIQEFGLGKFELNVLTIERTVVEKLASLIRMSYATDLKEIIAKTRHLYDLYMTYPIVKGFYNDTEKFIDMVRIVKLAEFDSRFKDMYPVENMWQNAPLFSVLEDPRIKDAYQNRFGAEFVYGELPDFVNVKKVLMELREILFSCDL